MYSECVSHRFSDALTFALMHSTLRLSVRAERNRAMDRRMLFEIEAKKIEEHLRRCYDIEAKDVDFRDWGDSFLSPRE